MPDRNRPMFIQTTQPMLCGSDYDVYALMYQRGIEHCIRLAMDGTQPPPRRYVLAIKCDDGSYLYRTRDEQPTYVEGFDQAGRFYDYEDHPAIVAEPHILLAA